jgi:methionyl-tRNA formyltransferase
MRVAFLGNAEWSVPPLEALAGSDHAPAAVVTRARKRAGRGGKLASTPVAESARRLRLPLVEVETVKSGLGFKALAAVRPEVLVVVAYGEILPAAVLDLPTVMPVNVHFSLLPELRGAAPVQRAILEGLAASGVTTIRMDEGMDTGPILLQQQEAISASDDAGTLGARLAAIGGRLLVDTLDRIADGALEERPQDGARATYGPKLKPDEEVIDWRAPPEAVVRRVRALSPAPGARTTLRARTLKVYGARWRDLDHGPLAQVDPAPGRLMLLPGGELAALAGMPPGLVVLDEVALEGRRRMSGEEFARGFRPQATDVLGS